jgi:UDP-2-acetamido-2,6-beta-L-arabino-hexul-4-ose reductase
LIAVHVVVTGAAGFVGKNLSERLRELGRHRITLITRSSDARETATALTSADFLFHLAGVNRPRDDAEFVSGNAGLTQSLCDALLAAGRGTPVAYASTTQAQFENPYGRSKRAAEEVLLRYSQAAAAPVYLLRLTNIFGKWCRPHYNSVVATFCHQVARGLPIRINDAAAPLTLIHIDDVVAAFLRLLGSAPAASGYVESGPVYHTTVGEVAQALQEFAASRASLVSPRVGSGFVRALYSTYVSYLPPRSFAYDVPVRTDPRGEFVEMLKTPDCGQFSYFTARPGVTRGEHYHHTKTEKFLVIQGTARFGFRNLDTGEAHVLTARGGEGRIVETIPGWVHNITNVGDDELVVMLWANEIFDRTHPDTLAMKVLA